MINGNGMFLKESKRVIPSIFSSFMKVLGISKFYYSALDKDKRGYIDILAGAFMFVEKTMYDSVKGFDEDYFMYGEDIDLSYKALKKGYSNYYLGDVKIIHFKGESTDKNSVYINRFYNAMYIFYTKHFNKFLFTKILAYSFFKFIISIKNLSNFSDLRLKLVNSKTAYKNTFLVTGSTDDKISIIATRVDLNYLAINKTENSLLIFDLNSISLSEIINHFDFISESNSFRIIVPNTNFYVGSDYADKKGQIIRF